MKRNISNLLRASPTAKEISVYKGDLGLVFHIDVDEEGETFLVEGHGVISVYNTQYQEQISKFQIQNVKLKSVLFVDSSTVITLQHQERVTMWNVTSAKEMYIIDKIYKPTAMCRVSQKVFIVGTARGRLHTIQFEMKGTNTSFSVLNILQDKTGIEIRDICANENHMVTVLKSGEIRIWDMNSKKCVKMLDTFKNVKCSIVTALSNNWFALANDSLDNVSKDDFEGSCGMIRPDTLGNGNIIVYKTENWEEVGRISTSSPLSRTLQICNDNLIYTGEDFSKIMIYDLSSESLVFYLRSRRIVGPFTVLPDGTVAVTQYSLDEKSQVVHYRLPRNVAQLLEYDNTDHDYILPIQTFPPLQHALMQVLQGSANAADYCHTLISKQNCEHSLAEWHAAHQLLSVAIRDEEIPYSPHSNGKQYWWMEQLYAIVTGFELNSADDWNHVKQCLTEAQNLGVIQSADALVMGKYIFESIRGEILVLRKAGIMLLERVVMLESKLEDLREAFERYKQTQRYSQLVGIAVKLIPIAGGAMAGVLSVGAELIEGLSVKDVVDYSLGWAGHILRDDHFAKLPEGKRLELEGIFREYGYTTEDIRILLHESEKLQQVSFDSVEVECDNKIVYRRTERADVSISAANKQERDNSPHRSKEKEDLDSDEVFRNNQVIGTPFDMHLEVSRSTTCSAGAPHVNIAESSRNEYQMNEMNDIKIYQVAKEWTQFILANGTWEAEEQEALTDYFVRFLDEEQVSTKMLRLASSVIIEVLTERAITVMDDKLKERLRVHEIFRMRQFLQFFAKEIDCNCNCHSKRLCYQSDTTVCGIVNDKITRS